MRDITDDSDIQTLVHAFYAKIGQDERLGFIFNEVAAVDWDHHLPRMVDFWSNLIFQTGRYQGRPFRQHLPLPIKMEDFSRWLTLFNETVDEHFSGENAESAKELAARIASSFAIRMDMEKNSTHTDT